MFVITVNHVVTAGDVFCAGKAYILVGHNGKMVSRIRRGTIDYMEAAKENIDIHTILLPSILWNGKVSFKSDNGQFPYLSRINRGALDNVEAAKPSIDIYSEFSVEVDSVGPWKGLHYIYLKADNGKYVGIKNRGGRHNMEASFNRRSNNTRFTLLEVN